MKIVCCNDYKEMSRVGAGMVAEIVKSKPACVLGLATGSTPEGLYAELIDMYKKGELDFSGVTFMDSSGIGMLIGRYKELQVFGGRIALICVNEKIKELLKLSGLSKLITCFETLEDALNYTEGRENHAV